MTSGTGAPGRQGAETSRDDRSGKEQARGSGADRESVDSPEEDVLTLDPDDFEPNPPSSRQEES
jgi:hypothetical protein